jgi:hypothetical protein
MAEQLDPEYLRWKAEKEERDRKRGRWWLTPEGRSEIRGTWGHDDDDGSTVTPLINELERVEGQRNKLLKACNDSLDLLASLIVDHGLPVTPKVAKLRNDLCAAIADTEGQIAEAEGGRGE